jgi:hypothetical protein
VDTAERIKGFGSTEKLSKPSTLTEKIKIKTTQGESQYYLSNVHK